MLENDSRTIEKSHRIISYTVWEIRGKELVHALSCVFIESCMRCTWEVCRALKKLEFFEVRTLLTCSPNLSCASINQWTHAKHEPIQSYWPITCCYLQLNTFVETLGHYFPFVEDPSYFLKFCVYHIQNYCYYYYYHYYDYY